jgi:hypothetical protein
MPRAATEYLAYLTGPPSPGCGIIAAMQHPPSGAHL